MNSATAGARCSVPKVTAHDKRSVPRGAAVPPPPTLRPPRGRPGAACTARETRAPLSVSESRRVVRFSSRVSRWASRSATSRDTDDTETPRRVAAPAKLPASTTLAKAVNSVELVHPLLLHFQQ